MADNGKNKNIALVICFLLILLPLISVADNFFMLEDNNAYLKLLDEATVVVANAESTKDEKDIEEAIKITLELPFNPDNHMTKVDLVNKLVIMVNEKDNRESLFKDLTTKTVETAEKTKVQVDIEIARELVEALPKSEIRTDLTDRLNVVQKEIVDSIGKDGNIYWDGGSFPYDWENVDPNDYEGGDAYGPGFKPGERENSSNNPINPVQTEPFSKIVDYVKEGGKCYKEITRIYHGQTPQEFKRVLASKEEESYCYAGGMTEPGKEYDFSKYVPGKTSSYGNSNNRNNNDYYNKKPDTDSNKPKESNITLQYTLNKNRENPSYTDTGIRVSTDNTIGYIQAKDALTQLAVKNGGKVVVDKDRVLALVEGRILIIKDTKTQITVSDFEKVFEIFNVQIKALPTQINKK